MGQAMLIDIKCVTIDKENDIAAVDAIFKCMGCQFEYTIRMNNEVESERVFGAMRKTGTIPDECGCPVCHGNKVSMN